MSVSLIDGHIDPDAPTFEELIEELEKVRYNVTSEYHKTVIDDAIEIMKRQKAEIERLQTEKENLRCVIEDLCDNTEIAKAEAIKEFAERLKEIITMSPKSSILIDKWYIDNLVKEMVGES